MSKPTNDKPKKLVVADKDHPSLIEVSGKLRLRVLEDFNIERDLPKWVRFREEWDKVKKELGIDSHYSDAEVKNKVNGLKDKTEEERAEYLKRVNALRAMDKAVQDDRWDIRGKHEREVNESVLKQAKYVRGLTFWDKLKNALGIGRRVVPVEVAMDELLEHLELTSTPEMSARLAKLKEIEANMRAAGQYKKADAVKDLRAIVVEESVVCAAGFTTYISEDTMIEFLKKSERGTAVDFLRYYEDEIPPDVVEKKVAVDKLMVFDNYVVAHYSNLIQKAATVEKAVSAEKEKKERAKRRDPILFGLIKNSRKLYYICDWVTDTDDLTLEKLEKELGVTRGSLVDGAMTGATGTESHGDPESDDTRRMVRELQRRMIETEDMVYSTRVGRAQSGDVYWR